MIIDKLGSGKYKVIYADPAWQFNNKKTGGCMSSGAAQHYNVSSLSAMKSLPIKAMSDEDSLLVMWWVGSMPQEAIDLCKAWGFKLLNMNGLVWNKRTKSGKQHFGMGYATRAGSESALIGYRGKLKNIIKDRSIRAVIEHSVGRHSEKPQIFRDTIVKLCGDVPRIELFARQEVEGWDCWGDEMNV